MSGHGPTKGAKYIVNKGRPPRSREAPIPLGAALCQRCGARLAYSDYLGRIVLYCPKTHSKEVAA